MEPPHEARRDRMAAPLASASHDKLAWRGSSFAGPQDFAVDFTQSERDELVAAVRALPRGKTIAELTKTDFPLPRLVRRLNAAYEDVRAGRGFVLLRGLPIDGLTLEEFIAAVYGIGLNFGRALSQNAQGELVTQVVDATKEDATPRMYRSNLELRPHNDITAMISLACWNHAQSGGVSVLVSGVTVHDEIERARAASARAALPRLPLSPPGRGGRRRKAGDALSHAGLHGPRAAQVSVRYQRAGIAAGHRELGDALTAARYRGAQSVRRGRRGAGEPAGLFPRSRRDGGDQQLRRHARALEFTNFPEPERQRLLVRLWLDARRLPRRAAGIQPFRHQRRPEAGGPPLHLSISRSSIARTRSDPAASRICGWRKRRQAE